MKKEAEYKKITAIILCEKLAEVEKTLITHHIAGVSVSTVKGYGEYHDYHQRDMMSSHICLDIYCGAKQVHEVAQCIMTAASTGMKGDGIVAISPVDNLYHIRTGNCVPIDTIPYEKTTQYFNA